MAFDPTTWVDGSHGGTPITAVELNRIEQGIVGATETADAAYVLPGTGIPGSQLAAAVQTSLGKADTAYQAPAVVAAGADQASARGAINAVANSAASISTTSESANSLNIVHDGATTSALRLEQQGSGNLAKWRSDGVDRGFILNDGGLLLIPADNGHGATVQNLEWQAGRAFGYTNKDYVIGLPGFVDYSGLPIASGVFQSYTKLFGATAEKRGPGNLDAFWATMHHYGPDEVGLIIGDVNTHNGGNGWGGDFRAYSDTTDASLFGLVLGVRPGSTRTVTTAGVTGTSLASTSLTSPSLVGATTLLCTANPGAGRFSVGSGSTLEYVSVLSVTGSGPYTATLSFPTAYDHAAGAAVTIVQTQVIGLHIQNEADNPADIALWINTPGGATGPWAEYIRCTDPAGVHVFQVGLAGLVKTSHLQPYDNGNRDLGLNSNRWRGLYVNSIAVNGADSAGGAGNINIHNTALAPPSTPSAGGVLWVESGQLNYKGSDGNTSVLSPVTSAATASALAVRDANANLKADAFVPGAATTVTAAGTTTLTVDSTEVQQFTGSTTQTVMLPTTGISFGQRYTFINNSTGVVTVQSSGGSTIVGLPAGYSATFTALQAAPTAAAHWQLSLHPAQSISNGAINGTIALRTGQANLAADAFIPTMTSTVTAAGTTTLTVDSTENQAFTGGTTQTVILPTTSVVAGTRFSLLNPSSGAITVNSSAGNLVKTIAAGASSVVTALQATPTTNAHWFATA